MRKVYIAFGIVLVLWIVTFALLGFGFEREFGQCKGLQGVVKQIWEGEKCDG